MRLEEVIVKEDALRDQIKYLEGEVAKVDAERTKNDNLQSMHNADMNAFKNKVKDMEGIIRQRVHRIEELEHLISMNNQTDEQKQNELNFWNGKVNNMRRDLEYQQQFSQNMIEGSEKLEREVTSLRQALDMKDKNQELL
jgi:chromosome segregation ATPase